MPPQRPARAFRGACGSRALPTSLNAAARLLPESAGRSAKKRPLKMLPRHRVPDQCPGAPQPRSRARASCARSHKRTAMAAATRCCGVIACAARQRRPVICTPRLPKHMIPCHQSRPSKLPLFSSTAARVFTASSGGKGERRPLRYLSATSSCVQRPKRTHQTVSASPRHCAARRRRVSQLSVRHGAQETRRRATR